MKNNLTDEVMVLEASIAHNSPTFITDCEIHGDAVSALLNGKCAICHQYKLNKSNAEETQRLLAQCKLDIGIPPRFIKATFANYAPQNEKAIKLLEFCKSYDFKSNLIMLGNTGNGKTHLGCAIIDQALTKRLTCSYVQFYRLAEIKLKKPNILQDLIACDLLVIDEYGVQDSDFKNNLLYEVVNERYNNLGNTVIISNLAIEAFRQSIGDPLYSRLKSNVIVKSCDWDDYRLKGAKK